MQARNLLWARDKHAFEQLDHRADLASINANKGYMMSLVYIGYGE